MAKGRKGRPRKAAEQRLRDSLERTRPNIRVEERRQTFAFVQLPPEARQDGRNGEIDSEVCDAIGQLCALGLLDGHGHDPVDLRDKGRFWGCHYAKVMKPLSVRTGRYERRDKSNSTDAMTAADLLFDRMDESLSGHERQVLLTLLVEPLIGFRETVPWAQSLIDEALLKRGKKPRSMRFPDAHDWALLGAAIRGLCAIVDGALPARWAA